MTHELASAYFDEPTPLVPITFPRKITRPQSSMTCPECDLRQSVALDCAGCGRIMKPSTDFRLADPLLAPRSTGLENVEPVEAVGPYPTSHEVDTPRPAFRAVRVDEPEVEGIPWLKMLLSLLFAGLAWSADSRLLAFEQAGPRTVLDLPVWLEAAHGIVGREGIVAGLVFVATLLMIVSARQVLSGR